MSENKKKWVETQLKNALCSMGAGIINVEYKLFRHKKLKYLEEFLVITFDGGAKVVRNCNANSKSAIFEEAAKMIYGGYYKEVSTYNKYLEDKNYKEVQE